MTGPAAHEQRLIQAPARSTAPTRSASASTQRLAVRDHGVVDGVPITMQLTGDVGHRPTETPDLNRSTTSQPGPSTPPAAPRCAHRGPSTTPPHTPGHDTTSAACATTSRVGRPKHGRSTNVDRRAVLHRRLTPALSTPALLDPGTRHGSVAAHPPRPPRPSTFDLGQADQQLTHARRVRLHRGSPRSASVASTDSVEPLYRARGSPPRSDPKSHYRELVVQLGDFRIVRDRLRGTGSDFLALVGPRYVSCNNCNCRSRV